MSDNTDDKQLTCFIAAPFAYPHNLYIPRIFEPAIAEARLIPVRADGPYTSNNIIQDIWRGIVESDVVLADMSGRNPNVLYELGLAHAASKPAVLVTADLDDIPFDLEGLRAHTYDIHAPGWHDRLAEAITQALLESIERPREHVLPTFLHVRPAASAEVPEDEAFRLTVLQRLDSMSAAIRSLEGNRNPRSGGTSGSYGVTPGVDAFGEPFDMAEYFADAFESGYPPSSGTEFSRFVNAMPRPSAAALSREAARRNWTPDRMQDFYAWAQQVVGPKRKIR